MLIRILLTLLIFEIYIFSQQAEILKKPSDLTLPAVLTEVNGTPKTGSMGPVESKWVSSSSSNAESLLSTYTSSSEIGIKQIIKDVLLGANIPEGKLSQLKINFSSSGVEERSIDKDAVVFKDDFTQKYPGESLFLITRLYRTKNAVIELTDGSAEEFPTDVKDAISGGLRIGNKTETVQGNKMVIEVPHLTYAYEYVPFSIEKVADKSLMLPLYMTTDVGLNSINSMSIGEGQPYDFLVTVISSAVPAPVEFRISNVSPVSTFRLGGREGYTLKYLEMGGNKVSFTISGYKISFQ